MRTCYISGPMRNCPKFNFPAFFEAEARWKSRGWNVISPARIDVEEDGFDVEAGGPVMPLDHYVRRDFEALMTLDPKTDVVVKLPGSEKSVGATAEQAIARWRGVDVVDDDKVNEESNAKNTVGCDS